MIIENKELEDLRYPIGNYIQINLKRINILADLIAKCLPAGNKAILLCRGSSGAIIAGIVSNHLISLNYKCSIQHVKKDNEEAHCKHLHIDHHVDNSYIIIDDFISTGRTVNTIYSKVSDAFNYPFNNYSLEIFMLAVTGSVREKHLNFHAENIIAHSYYE